MKRTFFAFLTFLALAVTVGCTGKSSGPAPGYAALAIQSNGGGSMIGNSPNLINYASVPSTLDATLVITCSGNLPVKDITITAGAISWQDNTTLKTVTSTPTVTPATVALVSPADVHQSGTFSFKVSFPAKELDAHLYGNASPFTIKGTAPDGTPVKLDGVLLFTVDPTKG